ncbi:MAG: hypothetical protein GX800_07840, partial [Clostridiaceae bacterium]|nr:hypothetical protein [Clostridiaceae bacterium]
IKYNDGVKTNISVSNTGTRDIERPFDVALYVNNKKVGSAVMNSLEVGGTAIASIEWIADILPTGIYTLRAFADNENNIMLINREKATKAAVLEISEALTLSTEIADTAFASDQKPEVFIKVYSTDAPYTPINDAVVKVEVYQGEFSTENIPNQNVWEQTVTNYQSVRGGYISSIQIPSPQKGNYTIRTTAEYSGVISSTVDIIKFSDDFVVTLDNQDGISYAVGESITVSGAVKNYMGLPVTNADVTIIVVGEEELRYNVKTAANGLYEHTFNLADDCGGAYSLKALATVDGLRKTTQSKVFYIDGFYIGLNNKVTLTQGYDVNLAGVVTNLGVVDEAGVNITVIDLPAGMSVSYEKGIANETLQASQSREFIIKLSANESVAVDTYTINIRVYNGNNETLLPVSVTVEEAIALYSINILGGDEPENEMLTKDNIAMSLRQGEVKTSVIQVTNKGTAPIKGLTVITPENIPFIVISETEFADIMPVNKGYSIRADGGRASIVVAVSPSDIVKAGVYEGEITLNSNAGELKIPIKIGVGDERVATCVFEIRDNNQTPLANANVTLSTVDNDTDAIKIKAVTDVDGRIRFENIPASSYIIRVEADYHTTLETTIEIPAIINPVPQVVNLQRQLFVIDYDEDTIDTSRENSISTMDYDAVVFNAKLLAESTDPQILPNFPADEKELYYALGMLKNKISIKNPSNNTKLENLTVQFIDIDDRIEENTLMLKADTGVTPVKTINVLNEGEITDIIWEADINKFFLEAEVSETQNAGEYKVVFPSDVTRDMIDGYISANDPAGSGNMVEISFNATTNTGIYRVMTYPDGGYYTPSNRVPKYFGDEVYEFDFKLLFRGEIQGSGQQLETIVPVRLRYIPPQYYVNAGVSQNYDDPSEQMNAQQYSDIYDIHPDKEQKIKVEPLFQPSVGNVSKMSYSAGFLKSIGMDKPNVPEEFDGAISDFGFANDMGFAEQITNVKFNLTNPSKLHSMENIEARLVISDAGYDENGNLLTGGNVLYPNLAFNVEGLSNYNEVNDGITNGTLPTGEKLTLEYSLKLDEINDIYSQFKNSDNEFADIFNSTNISKVFARIEGSFEVDGQIHYFSTTPKEYKVLPKPKLFVSYSFEGPDNGAYKLKAVISNLGEGEARGVYINKPVIPNIGFNFRVVGGRCNGKNATGQNYDTIQIGIIPAGATVTAEFDLVPLGNITNAQMASLGRLAAMPAMPVKSSINVGMVVSPMALEVMNQDDTKAMVAEMLGELDKLKINIENVADKTASEFARSVLDNWDYARQLTGAVGISKSYDMIGNLIALASVLKKMADIPKFFTKNYAELGKSQVKLTSEKSLSIEQMEKISISQIIMNRAKGELDDAVDGLIKNMDYGKVVTALTKDIVKTSEKIEEYQQSLKDYASTVKFGSVYKAYDEKMTNAKKLLENSTKLIDQAVKTTEATRRSELSAQALEDFKKAKTLFEEAKTIKDSAGGVVSDIITSIENAKEVYETGLGETVKQKAFDYVDSLEAAVKTQMQNVAINYDLIQSIDKVESKVKLIENSAAAIKTIANSVDATLANEDEEDDEEDDDESEDKSEEKSLEIEILENIGYNKAAGVLEKYEALKGGYTAIKTMVTSVLDVYDQLKKSFSSLMDVSQLDNIVNTTPEMVKNLGGLTQVIKTTPDLSASEIAVKVLETVFYTNTDVQSKYGWFIDEFVANYPTNDTQTVKDIYAIKEALKIHGFSVIDQEAYDKNLRKTILSGKSEYRAGITAALNSATSKKNVYAMLKGVEFDINQTKQLLQSYLNGKEMTAYYPAKQLTAYLKGLNNQLLAMYTYNTNGVTTNIPINKLGKYRHMWIYETNGMDLISNEIKMGDIYKTQINLDHLLAEGYNYIADRHLLNMVKHYETGAKVVGGLTSMFGASPAMAAIVSSTNVA